MSKGNELYVRKSRSSDQTMMSDTEDQMWDDSSMTAAYDKAVNKANAEIAKQIAMETNSKFKDNAKTNEKKGKATAKSLKTQSPKTQAPKTQGPKPKVWTEGMPCRAMYFEDGQEYEAVVYAILDNKECVVKFLGYENSEIVDIDTLKESCGDEPRMRQIEQATGDKFDDGFESLSNEETSGAAASCHQKVKKSQKKAQKPKTRDFPTLPNMPNMPNMPDLFSINAALSGPSMPDFRLPNIPFPPPPPPSLLHDPEDHALSSMLISWYMSGYHTGLYQGLKRSKENRRR